MPKFMGHDEKELRQLVRSQKALQAQDEADVLIDQGPLGMFAYLVERGILKDTMLCEKTDQPCAFGYTTTHHYACVNCGRGPGQLPDLHLEKVAKAFKERRKT